MSSTDLIDGKSIIPKITNSESKYFACSVCHELFTFKSNLQKHLRNHFVKIKFGPYICPICGISLRKRYCIDSHIAFHIGSECYKCDYCGEEFSLKNLLEMHLRRHSAKPFSCIICQKAFRYNCQLQSHYRSHRQEKPFVCIFCPKSFQNKVNLKVHYRTHTGERPYVCDTCQATFMTVSTWRTHNLQHSRDPKIKRKCHHSVPKQKPKKKEKKKLFSCHVCKESFSFQTQMSLHLRKHTGENPFTCNVCKQGFSGKFDLFRHIRTHAE